MKKLLLTLMVCLTVMYSQANPVTEQQAQNKAQRFLAARGHRKMSANNKTLRLASVRHYLKDAKQTAPCFYVFNIGNNNGFVLVGADDLMPDILGYADGGTYDEDTMPDNMKTWLEEYSLQMAWLHQHPEAAARKVVSGDAISPLLATTWNQTAPYNNLCPNDGTTRCVTGCVATAMAQVMYHYKWPQQTAADIPGYTSSSKMFSVGAVPAGTVIDWDNMLPSYTGAETENQKNAVAQLMQICGTSVEMDYLADASSAGTPNMIKAWLNYFDYDAGITYVSRSEYRLAQWNQMVYDELSAGRPVVYAGSSNRGGHAFLVDGYGGDDFFHVNWGWGGDFNNYFLLSILDYDLPSDADDATTSIAGYYYGHEAVIGIQPNTGTHNDALAMSTDNLQLMSNNTITRASASVDFTFKVSCDVWNKTGASQTFDYGAFGIYDSDDNLVEVACNYTTGTFDNYVGNPYHVQTLTFGHDINAGFYKVKPISRLAGTTSWHPNHCAASSFITAIIADNTITLKEPVISLSGSIEATGKAEAYSPLHLNITITNSGTLFSDVVYLVADNYIMGGRYVEIEEGETVTQTLSFVPSSSGTKSLLLCRKVQNGYVPFVSGSVTVSPQPIANISISSVIANANESILTENKMVIDVHVVNKGHTTYDNEVYADLYKLIEGTNQGNFVAKAARRIELTGNSSTDFQLTFNNLEDGATYFYYMNYYSNGKIKETWGAQATVILPAVLRGDANGDGKVNITDVAAIIDYIMNQPSASFNFQAADVNGDGKVNITDVAGVIDIIMAQ